MTHEKHISIIIPTHNRVASLERLLHGLGEQDYPMHLLEVVVVADGCRPDTIGMLQGFEAPYALKHLATDGHGPAVARNRGAAVATGELLLFLDDDVVPSAGLLAAHVEAHHTLNNVVIGYLPYYSQKLRGLYILQLRAWWENKFHYMRLRGYRFTYQDLLSGNFSLPADLFHSLGGFNESLRCREDYEFGVRLIEAGARFVFAHHAWGWHCDDATDFDRSLQRKRQEGGGDVALGELHPGLVRSLRLHSMVQAPDRKRTALACLYLVYRFPTLGLLVARLLHWLLPVVEALRLRNSWKKTAAALQLFWYLKGAAEKLPTLAHLRNFLRQQPPGPPPQEAEVDVKMGIKAVEALLDATRPAAAHIRYGNQHVGHIRPVTGAERLRGVHVVNKLATVLSWPLYKAMLLDDITANNNQPSMASLQPAPDTVPHPLTAVAYGNQST